MLTTELRTPQVSVKLLVMGVHGSLRAGYGEAMRLGVGLGMAREIHHALVVCEEARENCSWKLTNTDTKQELKTSAMVQLARAR
jgi:hypothetical protein